MFPPLRVSFGGAKLNQKYIIAMDIVPTDSKRYRYAYHRSSWLVAGKADPPVQSRLFIHPDGPFTGDTLYKQIVSFEKVKLTNNEMDKCGHVSKRLSFRKEEISNRKKIFFFRFYLAQIVLNSMHKYQPRVHIIKKPDDSVLSKMSFLNAVAAGGGPGSSHPFKLQVSADLDSFEYKTFIFPETSFIAVTAYQNQLVN
jgi:T-box protein 20